MKSKTKILLGSALTIAMCASLITGSTLALFTSESKTNIAVTSGKVEVTATIDADSLKTYSYKDNGSGTYVSTEMTPAGTFETGGMAEYKGGENKLTLSNIVPGDKAEFNITIANHSSVDVQYQYAVATTKDIALFNALKIKATESEADVEFVENLLIPGSSRTKWTAWAATGEKTKTVHISVELPYSSESDVFGSEGSIQDMSCELTFTVNATQGNAKTQDPIKQDFSGTNLEIANTAELEGFRNLVDSGETFEGKTIKISDSVQELKINADQWIPIGTEEQPFKGSFDGNGKTIVFQVPEFSAASVAESANHSLFGTILGSADQILEIKNFTIVNAKVEGDNVGVLADVATNVAFSDITIKGMLQISGKSAGFIAGDFSGSLNNIRIDPNSGSTVFGSEYAGGLCGKIDAGAQISNIFINTNGTADKHFMNSDHTAYLAQPTVNINGKGEIGGIAGHLGANVNVSTVGICAKLFLLSDSAEKNEEASTTIGVFSGIMEGTGSTFNKCYFTGWLVDFVYFGNGFDYEKGAFQIQVYCILDKKNAIFGNPINQGLIIDESAAYFISGGMLNW